ncbi:TPA: hypothetical protein ACLQU7_000958 [Bacillus tropicus]|uniref:hypothetical protein n=1 Tax=Bacillus tropicus TaxID=2026188 RepID=UPI00003CB440|nr:hypothetical protein [Bacillus tropicus]AIY76127.1 putative membrane protein [Bacillus cereus]AJI07279.1 putative membrane protein [Bacillus cereus G9241]ARO16865.1 hypothetical protein B2J90_04895 [Bacillus cereus]EAL16543.1 conserved hypothetical protein protein [Bacillus cereus G9241]QPS52462.1 hypothetical protein I6G54_10585 [Bacillus tropicus]
MNISKKYVHIALIWFLASFLCLQVSYAVHTTSITIGWVLTAIFFMISLIATKKHSVNA